MGLFSIVNKIGNYYQQGGIEKVMSKCKEVGPVKIMQAKAEFLWRLHGEGFQEEEKENIREWKIYTFLKRKYGTLISNSNYLENYQKQNHTTPKIIWWCWLQGEENAPSLCKAALASLRKNYPDYDIRVVTFQNIKQYVEIPDYIEEKFQSKKMAAAHYSDILRTLLLIKHGGVWIDSTVFSSKRATDILEEPLFFYQNFMRGNDAIICSNWLIASTYSQPILLLTRDLLFQYWKDFDFAIHYYIYHFFFHMAAEKYYELWEKVPLYSNVPVHVMQKELFKEYNSKRFEQIMRMADFHKLTHHLNTTTEGDVSKTNYEHIITMMGEKIGMK